MTRRSREASVVRVELVVIEVKVEVQRRRDLLQSANSRNIAIRRGRLLEVKTGGEICTTGMKWCLTLLVLVMRQGLLKTR